MNVNFKYAVGISVLQYAEITVDNYNLQFNISPPVESVEKDGYVIKNLDETTRWVSKSKFENNTIMAGFFNFKRQIVLAINLVQSLLLNRSEKDIFQKHNAPVINMDIK